MTLTMTVPSRPKSEKLFKAMCEVIPGGANSPVRSFSRLGMDPMIVDKGEGDTVYDIDGNRYIDYCCSWGPLIHGHCHPHIIEAAHSQMIRGTTFGISCPQEEKLARLIVDNVPSVEKIRFVSSGTEATMSAARLARGYTGRPHIVKFTGNYHGHADMFLVQAGSGVLGITPTSTSAGIPEEIVKNTVCLEYNDIQGTRDFLLSPENRDLIAGVILEPVAGNIGCVPADPQFIAMLREVTSEIGALLIFDEVITGFRLGLKGAQGYYGVDADLTCFGKVVGGGFPAAAFGGRQEVMDKLAPLGPVYQAGTLSGSPVAMAAGAKAIEMLMEAGVFEGLRKKADLITKPVQEKIEELGLNACIQQVGSMFTLFFGAKSVSNMQDVKKLDAPMFVRFFKYMFANGVYIPPMQQEAWFVSTVHTEEHLVQTRDLILAFLEEIK